ncbi:MAG: hypothetical protein IKE01_02235 [Clostridia bacterium]|nr:hypothetical protein [Clostridia bacterium]
MEENTNFKKKKIFKYIIIVILLVLVSIGAKILVDIVTINNQMKNAETAITINKDVHMYSSAKEKKKYENIELGTDVYVLDRIIDDNGKLWCKVKVGKKVGYILSRDIGKYRADYGKKDLMLDVSKFNLEKNFSSINEFKAFVINNDIKFVYIRAGGRGYGKAGNFYTDPNADEYAKACEFLKIPFGYYFLEEAINSDEVNEEVDFITEYLNNHKYSYNKLPLALDVEKHSETGRADSIWDTRYNLINELTEKLQDKGNRVILYSNAKLANQYLNNVEAKMWLAYYPQVSEIPNYWYSDTSADGANNIDMMSKMIGWQFTENGTKNKIKEKVDLSIVYSNYLLNDSMEDVENDIRERNEKILAPVNKLIDIISNILK